jgi:hypothetical protein
MKNILTLAMILISFMLEGQCVNGFVEINFDNYAGETSWEITNTSGTIVASGGSYPASFNNTLQSFPICLPASSCMNFKITDSYGDGICCNYGSGFYNVKFNNEAVITGGQFTTFDTKAFCVPTATNGGGGSGPTCNDGTQNGNETGVDCGGTCPSVCQSTNGNINGFVEIKFDGYAGEVSWNITNTNGIVLANSTTYNSDLNYTLQLYPVSLPSNSCHTFKISDSYGDGICCSNGSGFYNVKFNGINLATGGQYTTEDIKSFCTPTSNTGSGGSGSGGNGSGGNGNGGNGNGGFTNTCSDGVKNGDEKGIDCGGSCPECPQRNIVFVHGLGGTEFSWARMEALHSKFNGGITIPNWALTKTDSKSITYAQTNLVTAGVIAAGEITQKMQEMRGNSIITAPNYDILIAHSQGGLVSREAHKAMVTSNQTIPFGGIITFGTPHGGAQIVNSILAGHVSNWLASSCNRITEGPFQEGTNSNTIFTIASLLLNATEAKQKLCNQAISNLGPFIFDNSSATPAIKSDFAVNAVPLNTLNNFGNPGIEKISAYGIEEEPVFWRQVYSFTNDPNIENFFEANYDDQIVNDAIVNLNKSINKVARYQFLMDYYWYSGAFLSPPAVLQYIADKKSRDGWRKTQDFWENANNEYKTLIGGNVTNYGFNGECTLSYYDYGNLVGQGTTYTNTPEECYDISYGSATSSTEGSPVYNSYNVAVPSDALVTEESQKAFPGATTILMNKSNHQQMRNDSNTKDVLNRIYNGEFGIYWTMPRK